MIFFKQAAALHKGLDKQIENLKLLEANLENDGIKFPKSKSMPISEPDDASSELGSSPCPGWPNTGKKAHNFFIHPSLHYYSVYLFFFVLLL